MPIGAQQQRRIAAQRDDVGVGVDCSRFGPRADDADRRSARARGSRVPKRNSTPRARASSARRCVNLKQSPVSSPGRQQARRRTFRVPARARAHGGCSRRDRAARRRRRSRAARRRRRRCRRTASGCERAAACPCMRSSYAMPVAARKRAQAVAAVLGEPDHPCLVDARSAPPCSCAASPATQRTHRQIEMRPDDERPVVHHQPFDRLQRNARPGPRRRVARRDLAGVGEARLERRRLLAIEHGRPRGRRRRARRQC